MDDVGRRQSRLGEPWRVKIVAAAGPQHQPTNAQRFAPGEAGKEQRRRRVIGERTALRGRFMQGTAAQPSPAEPAVELRKSERHDPMFDDGGCDRPQMCERGRQGNMGNGHGLGLYVFTLCSVVVSNIARVLIVSIRTKGGFPSARPW